MTRYQHDRDAARLLIWISLTKRALKIVKTISAHSKSTGSVFRTFKIKIISRHYPFKAFVKQVLYVWSQGWEMRTEKGREGGKWWVVVSFDLWTCRCLLKSIFPFPLNQAKLIGIARETVRCPSRIFLLFRCDMGGSSVADPWHFGVDPDPRIHASD